MAKKDISEDIRQIKNLLATQKPPEPFGAKDFIYSFFGALVVGLTFMFKGLLIETGLNLKWLNVILIVIATLIILSVEIYFVGYSKVPNKKERPFGQFLAKRLLSIYLIAIIVSFMLAYLYGINYRAETTEQLFKIILAVSMPCAIGAAFTNLLKKY